MSTIQRGSLCLIDYQILSDSDSNYFIDAFIDCLVAFFSVQVGTLPEIDLTLITTLQCEWSVFAGEHTAS